MDWLSEINSFPPFELKESGLDISAKEASLAVTKYEKALKNAQNDSLDIAIIELRKLVVLYPEMGQAAILLGCCQMQENQPIEALKNFRKASLSSLQIGFVTKLEQYLKSSQETIDFQQANPEFKLNRPKYPINSSPEIIAATPGKWKKVKVASDKEKRDVMNSNSSPQVKETFVDERMDINWVKVGIITISVLFIVGIGIVLYVFVPKAIDNFRNSGNKAETKLEWILDRLNNEEKTNSAIEKILKDYDGTFYPTPSLAIQSSSEASLVSPTAAIPTPSTAPTINDKIVLAAQSIQQAEKIGKTDPKKVMQLITKATTALLGIDENATAPTLTMNAGEIMAKASLLIKNIVNAACYPFYSQAKAKVSVKAYQEAIVLFLKVYDINPDYLDGGNAYNLGKAYAEAGQIADANKYFQYVVKKFPGTDVAGWAAGRIKPTGEIKE